MNPTAFVVLTTLASEADARALVTALLADRLIACGTLLPGGRSLYRWQGKMTEEAEVVVLLKTDRSRWDALCGAVGASRAAATRRSRAQPPHPPAGGRPGEARAPRRPARPGACARAPAAPAAPPRSGGARQRATPAARQQHADGRLVDSHTLSL